ncbi:protein of unknown function [Mesobacillus persicus]|uniref:DUF4397 domain-containing protein n=1 Tax=Mesobacillus persicus TaxID=930146 RepID=A0A1H8BF81_9BACI|nr:DUF4397 domain-containing protein [Mesobacillus persicus]SEM81591.1 protein of unknown function [Mesobacillus persicus]
MVREWDMTVMGNQQNYLYKAAMYQESANYNTNRNHHSFNSVNRLKGTNEASRSAMVADHHPIHSATMPSSLRFLHFAKNMPSVDVYVDDVLIANDFSYSYFNHYLSMPSGKHQIDLTPAGDSTTSILSKKIILQPGRWYTLAATEKSEKQKLLAFEDQPYVPAGESKLRFLHLSPHLGDLDIAVKSRDVIFPELKFKGSTSYLGITPMKLDLEGRSPKNQHVVLSPDTLVLEPNITYTAIISDEEVLLLRDII